MKIREIMETLQLNRLLDKGDRTYNQLLTPWGEQIDSEQREVVLTEYPRPQLARKNHIILNGIWKYAFTSDDDLGRRHSRAILAGDVSVRGAAPAQTRGVSMV